MSFGIDAYGVGRHLRPLVAVFDVPFLTSRSIDGLELSFDDARRSSARQLEDGIDDRRLHERWPLSALPGNLRIIGRLAFLPLAFGVFDIGYTVRVDGGLLRHHVIGRPASRKVLIVVRATDFVSSRDGDEVRAFGLVSAFDGPAFGITDRGPAMLQFHQARFRMEAEEEQHQKQDKGRDGEKRLHGQVRHRGRIPATSMNERGCSGRIALRVNDLE